MTDLSNKKSKDKRYHHGSEPFDAGDISVAPLADDFKDEDAIDRLLSNTGFDSNNEDVPAQIWSAFFDTHYFSDQPKELQNNTKTDIKSLESAIEKDKNKARLFEQDSVANDSVGATKKLAGVNFDSWDSNFEIDSNSMLFEVEREPEIAQMTISIDNDIVIEDIAEPKDNHQDPKIIAYDIDSTPLSLNESGRSIGDVSAPFMLEEFKLHQELINRQHQKLIKNLESKIKKTKILATVALIIAATALAILLTST